MARAAALVAAHPAWAAVAADSVAVVVAAEAALAEAEVVVVVDGGSKLTKRTPN